MKLLAFTKYGRAAASTRQRLLQYLPALAAAGIEVKHRPLLPDAYVESLESGADYPRTKLLQPYASRLRDVLNAGAFDAIWIYAELFPYLPAWFERLAFSSGKPVIYDFDDAFFHQYDDSQPLLRRKILGGKLVPLLRGAAACCCGNPYLSDYASQFNGRSLILPTTVDTSIYSPASAPHDQVVIGWIGSPSTWRYVKPWLPLLEEIARRDDACIRIVGAGAEAEADRFAGMETMEWSEAAEVGLIQSMDIGIMPLPDERWARGKSGYKLIQYGACGLPAVASPVGVNTDIILDGESGFLATSPEQWKDALTRLSEDVGLRKKMGRAGRSRVEHRYSLHVHAPRLVDVVREAIRGV
jgi:glycosyltransferase involved in cell wall biosynthesis